MKNIILFLILTCSLFGNAQRGQRPDRFPNGLYLVPKSDFPNNPKDGQFHFDSVSDTPFYYDGTGWKKFTVSNTSELINDGVNEVSRYVEEIELEIIDANLILGGVASTINTKALLAANFTFTENEVIFFKIVGNDVYATINNTNYTDVSPGANLGAFRENQDITFVIERSGFLTSLEYATFQGASNLTSIHLPGVVNADALNAFLYTTNLEVIEMPKLETIGYNGFRGINTTGNIYLPKLSFVDSYAFRAARFNNLFLPSVTSLQGIEEFYETEIGTIHMPNLKQIGADPSVFYKSFFNVPSGTVIVVNIALKTANAGAIHPDLEYAINRGAIIKYAGSNDVSQFNIDPYLSLTGKDPQAQIQELKDEIDAVVLASSGETAATVKTKYESNADTNVFTDAEKSKLASIEANATSDLTGVEIQSILDTYYGNTFWRTSNGLSNPSTQDLDMGGFNISNVGDLSVNGTLTSDSLDATTIFVTGAPVNEFSVLNQSQIQNLIANSGIDLAADYNWTGVHTFLGLDLLNGNLNNVGDFNANSVQSNVIDGNELHSANPATIPSGLPRLDQVEQMISDAQLSSGGSPNFSLGDDITGDFTIASENNGQVLEYAGTGNLIITIPDDTALGLSTQEDWSGFNFTIDVSGGGNVQIVYASGVIGDVVESSAIDFKTTFTMKHEKTANTWGAWGNCISYNPLVNIYTGTDALSGSANANSLPVSANFSVDGGSVLSIVNNNSVYSVRSTSNSGGGISRFRIYFDVVSGETYNFSLDGFSNAGVVFSFTDQGHTLISVDSDINMTNSNNNYTRTLTATGTGRAEFEFSLNNPSANDYIEMTNLIITQN